MANGITLFYGKSEEKQPKQYPEIKVKLPNHMSFDEAMRRIVRVKPPKDDKPNEIC